MLARDDCVANTNILGFALQWNIDLPNNTIKKTEGEKDSAMLKMGGGTLSSEVGLTLCELTVLAMLKARRKRFPSFKKGAG